MRAAVRKTGKICEIQIMKDLNALDSGFRILDFILKGRGLVDRCLLYMSVHYPYPEILAPEEEGPI